MFFLTCGCSNPYEGGASYPPTPVFPDIHENPVFHPDGQRILYQNNAVAEVDEGGSHTVNFDSVGLWISDKDGSNSKMLINRYGDFRTDFSPDEDWIVYAVDTQIYKAPFTGDLIDVSQIVKLTPGGRNFFPDWSYDGERIAHDRSLSDKYGPSGVWIMRKDGSEWHYVFGGGSPSWHPNGESIVGEIAGKIVNGKQQGHRFIRYYFSDVPPDTLDAVAGKNNRYPKISPDGNYIVFQSNMIIYVMDIDGTNIKRLSDGYHPSWSPDSRQIVFIRSSPNVQRGLGTIWIID
ncbi:TolB family protein [candidate division KSB1 bacterium]